MIRPFLRFPASHSLKSWTLRPPIRSFNTTPHRTRFHPTYARFQESPIKTPSFREEVLKSTPEEAFTEKVGGPGIRNQVLFVVFGSCLALTYAAAKTNVETEYWRRKLTSSSAWSFQSVTNIDMKRAQGAELIKTLRSWYASISGAAQEVPGLIKPWLGVAFISLMQPYADASEGKRLCWKICLLNAGVYAAWKLRRFRGTMNVRFMHNPLSGLSYTLLTSMFSHRSFFHLLFNCLALESFGSAAYYYLLREQDKLQPAQLESTSAYHFLAFFISAGLFSGLVSHVVSAKLRYPRLVAQLSSPAAQVKKTETWAAAVAATAASATPVAAKKATTDILPSLGASGAIYAAVTLSALAFPDSQVALFIPPSYPIPIQWGVGGIVALDLIGVMRGWRVFDHWAHLGGAAFGVAYYAYGPTIWHNIRRTLQPEQGESGL